MRNQLERAKIEEGQKMQGSPSPKKSDSNAGVSKEGGDTSGKAGGNGDAGNLKGSSQAE